MSIKLSGTTQHHLISDVKRLITDSSSALLSYEEFFGIIKSYAPHLTTEQLEEVGQELGFWLAARTPSKHDIDIKEG